MHMTMATGTSGHTFGVRVQRVHKVQRVQRVVVAPFGRRLQKGARLRRGLCRRVASLRLGGDSPHGLRGWWRPSGADYKKPAHALRHFDESEAKRSGEISLPNGT